MHVVVVDDEARLVALVTSYLEELGYTTTGCHSGLEAMVAAHDVSADVMVLDLMLPGANGVDVCRTLRREGVDIPILMLTARGSVAERVAGLEAGADDYLVKPFALEELAARVKVLGRRRDGFEVCLGVGDLTMNRAEHRVLIGGNEVDLPRREYQLLEELLVHEGRAVSRQQLFDAMWDGETDIRSNALEVYVYRLRARLSAVEMVQITTVRGRGYRLESTGSTSRDVSR